MTEYVIKRHDTGALLYTGGGESLRDVVEAAVLAGASLAGANLDGANLAGANLDGANLTGASLAGANLDGANLDGAYLAGAYLTRANLTRASLNGAKLLSERPIIQVGPIGSRCAYLVAYLTEAGVRVRAGCFSGSLDEFRAAVAETHGESVHGREYAAAIAMIEAHAECWTPAWEVTHD
jgi:hypothetical protein